MIDPILAEKLRKVLALTSSPVEGEAQAATAMLAKLLEAHNLDIADLETRGQAAPGIQEKEHDLGKAAFTWKLDLAETVATHFFCEPIVDRKAKTVIFVGRPDNVASLKMLYEWLIDQIKRISADERRKHLVETNEHIDPLRWQVGFGLGAVSRLEERLAELVAKRANNAASTALVIHHASEISDYLEVAHGYRKDGKRTKADQAWYERQEARWAVLKTEETRMQVLKETDLEAYYQQRPWERPPTAEQQENILKERAREDARYARNAARRKGRRERYISDEDYQRMEQRNTAHSSGHRAAERINIEPFLTGKVTKETVLIK